MSDECETKRMEDLAVSREEKALAIMAKLLRGILRDIQALDRDITKAIDIIEGNDDDEGPADIKATDLNSLVDDHIRVMIEEVIPKIVEDIRKGTMVVTAGRVCCVCGKPTCEADWAGENPMCSDCREPVDPATQHVTTFLIVGEWVNEKREVIRWFREDQQYKVPHRPTGPTNLLLYKSINEDMSVRQCPICYPHSPGPSVDNRKTTA